MAVFRVLRAERDTDAGLAAAERWLGLRENLDAPGSFPDLPPTAVAIWDRYLAYAVAFGLAATTVHAVPLGAESDTEAWSAVGGRWRIVRVRYPAKILGWGRPPWAVLASGLVQTVVIGAVAGTLAPSLVGGIDDLLDDAGGDQQALVLAITAGFLVLLAVASLVALRALAMLVLGGMDVGRTVVVDGNVLRLRQRGDKDSPVTYVAVDDGTTDEVRAWIPRTAATGLRQGASVRAEVSPRLGFVRSLEVRT